MPPLDYFGTDFDIHGLVRRLNDNEVIIPSFDPSSTDNLDVSGFQRQFVWERSQQIRFIESLLLGFPVPGIFLVQQQDKKLLVLDGQQRLRTLRQYYERGFKLEDVVEHLEGKYYKKNPHKDDELALDAEERRVLDNTFIHAIVVKYTHESEESIYQLFERINTGGTKLYPHEVRVALSSGPLINLIRDLSKDSNWIKLYGKKVTKKKPPQALTKGDRLRDQELILRCVALTHEGASYKRPLRVFLDKFAADHRHMKDLDDAGIRNEMLRAFDLLWKAVANDALRLDQSVNTALADAVICGLVHRLRAKQSSPKPEAIKKAHARLISDPKFRDCVTSATADEEKVQTRLRMAREAFDGC